ncbi:carboxypeptidase-like regulatory domain-containing protein, partial [Acidobacteria bacterium AH-259-L09]|nr:carboxypeptidase-like regulatory domain-containing protein [Acidobacteria bacterium AH-259-L09]
MRRLVVICLTVGLAAGSLLAQAQSNTADLLGVVKDQTGAVLPGVDIGVTNLATGFTRSGVTNDEGAYRVPLIPPGEYEVRAGLPGFTTKIYPSVVLTVGQYANLDITLEVSPAETEVIAVSNTAIVEREKTVQASTIQEVEIDNLPINGRNYLDFTLLTPGVSDKNALVTAAAVQTPTSGLSFAGQDQRSNYVTIDGADNMDVISNGVRSTLSQEAIQEFQISRNTFSAEFGRARAGMINIVSKSGTNDFHGNAFFFFRNNSLDARNAFAFGPGRSPVDPPFERYQWGGTLGGPIVEDKTFFFANYERLDRDESIFVTFLEDESIFQATPSQLELFAFLGSTGVPPLQLLAAAFINPDVGVLNTKQANFPDTLNLFQSESGVFPLTADSDTVSLKLDHQFSQNNQ